MSPFAASLREFRRSLGLKAALLPGYEQSYLSAPERSVKGPPRRSFTDRLVRKLALSSTHLELSIQFLYCAAKTPIQKGSIECHIRTTSADFIYQQSGTTFSNVHERGDYLERYV